jgi:predicted nucleic acid-binding protein
MSDRFFVDTDILMYAHDRAAGAKHERAKARRGIVAQSNGRRQYAGAPGTSGRSTQEGGSSTRRKATREIVADYLAWHVVVNGAESILEALDLEVRFQISFWDALVVHAAQSAGTQVLYSEDLSDGQLYGAVRVMNPFRLDIAP